GGPVDAPRLLVAIPGVVGDRPDRHRGHHPVLARGVGSWDRRTGPIGSRHRRTGPFGSGLRRVGPEGGAALACGSVPVGRLDAEQEPGGAARVFLEPLRMGAAVVVEGVHTATLADDAV